jgi:outer membrane phospholipase A
MDYNIEWSDIIEYFDKNSISKYEKEELTELLDINNTPDWSDVKQYLSHESLSTYEQNEILSIIDHYCENDEDTDESGKSLSVKTLLDRQKFEIIENLYNNYTLDDLQGFEKKQK